MRFVVLVVAFLLIGRYAQAQGEENSLKGTPWRERIITGGGFGLNFTEQQDFISLSPSIGYAVTRKLITGVGISYQYVNFKNAYQGRSVAIHNYSLNPFARFIVKQGFFIQAEVEHLRYQGVTVPSLEKTNNIFQSVMAGGGIIQPMGDRASFYAMALYNFSYRTPQSGSLFPYNSPWVLRAGISMGRISFF